MRLSSRLKSMLNLRQSLLTQALLQIPQKIILPALQQSNQTNQFKLINLRKQIWLQQPTRRFKVIRQPLLTQHKQLRLIRAKRAIWPLMWIKLKLFLLTLLKELQAIRLKRLQWTRLRWLQPTRLKMLFPTNQKIKQSNQLSNLQMLRSGKLFKLKLKPKMRPSLRSRTVNSPRNWKLPWNSWKKIEMSEW